MRHSYYFDYNATTPLDKEVADDVVGVLTKEFGNPSSVHHVGQQARFLLDDYRDRISKVWNCKPSEIVFTSGGTESNNLAILGTVRLLKNKGRHIVTSTIEHHAVLHAIDYLEKFEGFSVTKVGVSSDGFVDPEDVSKAIQPDTILVSIMAANNEIGSIQPVSEIGRICREKDVLFHTDAVQWFGKKAVEDISIFNADLVSVCGHKFHGPKGSGALYVKSPLLPHPILLGGAHENERRAGTENLPNIAGLTSAIEKFTSDPVFQKSEMMKWTQLIRDRIAEISAVKCRSPLDNCLPNTLSFTVKESDGMMLIANFDLEGICVSSGSACSAGSIEPSHVIEALGATKEESSSLVRISMGRENNEEGINHLLECLPKVIEMSRG